MLRKKSTVVVGVSLLISIVSNPACAELRQPTSIDARQVTSDDVEWTLSGGSAHVDLCSCDSSSTDCGSGVGCGSAVAPTSCLTRPRLLGDAFGAKSWLAEHGVITDFILGNYYQGVASGGNEQTDAYGGKVDMIFMFQGEKFGLNKGFNVAMHAETRFGQDISSEAGPLTLPNAPLLWPLPGDYHGTNITGLMLTQSLFDGKADAVFGKLNVLDVVDILLPEVAGGREGFMNVNGLVSALPWFRYVNLSVWGGGAWTNKPQGVGSAIIFFGTENVSTDWDFSESFEDGVGLLAMHRHFYEIGGKQGYIMGARGWQHEGVRVQSTVRLARYPWRRSREWGTEGALVGCRLCLPRLMARPLQQDTAHEFHHWWDSGRRTIRASLTGMPWPGWRPLVCCRHVRVTAWASPDGTTAWPTTSSIWQPSPGCSAVRDNWGHGTVLQPGNHTLVPFNARLAGAAEQQCRHRHVARARLAWDH